MPLLYFYINYILQGKVKTPLCWAFQKDSELAEVFNYHLQKMRETGTMSYMRQQFNLNKKRDARKLQDAHVLGFENVAFPFLALLTGVSLAFIQVGIEFVMFYKCA